MVREHRPDLVLLDLPLPDMLGRDVLRTLHADPRTAHIPVIVLSADATPSQVDRLLASGAVAYITKPLDVHHFLQVLDATLQREVC
jgi:CheY-like chemotaxis protein